MRSNGMSYFRHKHGSARPKRRIAPTPVKSTIQSSLFGTNDVWKEPDSHQEAFANSQVKYTSNLEKALDEDRRQIKREITSQRHKHSMTGKGKGGKVQLDFQGSGRSFSARTTKELNDGVKEVTSCYHSADLETTFQEETAKASVDSHIQDVGNCVSDPSLLDQLASLHSQIIKS